MTLRAAATIILVLMGLTVLAMRVVPEPHLAALPRRGGPDRRAVRRGLAALRRSKAEAGRPKDLDDLEHLPPA